ncbi:N-acetylgalactosamine-6-sulfatase [Amylibacter marinus]|uniref:N-acetylgalactosamine-6-sulfatase n=1 Tax=Amylibacter marinus TaxID=1475483 RepID=A0ABQ5VTV9_9RHOB|nr:sulfatase-like hydrolase/transferase [Amylibacter marinus]GLQ34607.1 N-acetylgalactosamine-6-sulfatase [Amylibacter marinus]
MKRIATLTLITALIAVQVGTANANPNILLVIADDMGREVSPCYDLGSDKPAMPTLEHLCATGMVLENAYVAPTCSPTRASIITGKYGFRTGVGSVIKGSAKGLSSHETSLFDLFSAQAPTYATAVIGKWHLAKSDSNHPAKLGVENYYGLISGGLGDYYNWTAVENGKRVKVRDYSTSHLTDRAIEFIGAQNSPWFLWLAYNAPHTPFHVPPADLHSQGTLNPDAKITPRNARPYYLAALEALDHELGRLLGGLDAKTRANTVIIFMGDNGSPGKISRRFYASRGAKGGIFEGGTHVPMVFSGPRVMQGRSEALVNSTDLFSTIAALAGIQAHAPDSISMIPLLQGRPNGRDYAYVEHFGPTVSRANAGWAIRDQRYKLVELEDHAPMLFDLKHDPKEHIDLLSGAADARALAAKANLLQAYARLGK